MTFIKVPRPVHHCQCGDHAWVALTRGYVTLVSPEDAHLLEAGPWNALVAETGSVYARSRKMGGYLHRIILASDEVDHKSRVGTDNRRPNLRPCTRQQNAANRNRKAGRVLPRGVYENKSGGFIARIADKGTKRNKNLGTYSTAEEAARVYDAEALSKFGEFARMNFDQA